MYKRQFFDSRRREEGRENLIIQLLIKHSPKEVADFTGIPLEEILRIEQSKLTTV